MELVHGIKYSPLWLTYPRFIMLLVYSNKTTSQMSFKPTNKAQDLDFDVTNLSKGYETLAELTG